MSCHLPGSLFGITPNGPLGTPLAPLAPEVSALTSLSQCTPLLPPYAPLLSPSLTCTHPLQLNPILKPSRIPLTMYSTRRLSGWPASPLSQAPTRSGVTTSPHSPWCVNDTLEVQVSITSSASVSDPASRDPSANLHKLVALLSAPGPPSRPPYPP